MKKLLLLLQFIFLSVNVTYSQFASCEIKSVCENDLLQNEDLIDFFQNKVSNEAQDEWYTLYLLVDEVDFRVNKDALNKVSDYLISSSKSVENLTNEIKSIGGYNIWKFRTGVVDIQTGYK